MCTVSQGSCGSLKPGKSWNSKISFSRSGKLKNLMVGHKKLCKMTIKYVQVMLASHSDAVRAISSAHVFANVRDYKRFVLKLFKSAS